MCHFNLNTNMTCYTSKADGRKGSKHTCYFIRNTCSTEMRQFYSQVNESLSIGSCFCETCKHVMSCRVTTCHCFLSLCPIYLDSLTFSTLPRVLEVTLVMTMRSYSFRMHNNLPNYCYCNIRGHKNIFRNQ